MNHRDSILFRIADPMAGAVLLLCAAVIIAYPLNFVAIYRPFVDGPSTNPLTALFFLIISAHILSSGYGRSNWVQWSIGCVAFLLPATVLIDRSTGTNISAMMTPFADIVSSQIQNDIDNSVGMNTAATSAFLAVSLLLFEFGYKHTAQIFIVFLCSIPVISLVGFAYNLPEFYGQMSLTTTTLAIMASSAALAKTSEEGFVYAIFSPHLHGKISRIQLGVGLSFILMMGYLFVQSIRGSQAEAIYGLFVVAISWLILALILVSAYFMERDDKKRRRLEHHLQHAAETDPLTGLFNRRRFESVAEGELQRVQRNKQLFWVLIVDIDFFKRINDQAGHAVGDYAIIAIAKTLQSSVRKIDCVARLGGEEFGILLLEGTDKDKAIAKVAENIRKSIAATIIPGWTEKFGPVTASIGVARADAHRSFADILHIADMALYDAKTDGRNCVRIGEMRGDVVLSSQFSWL